MPVDKEKKLEILKKIKVITGVIVDLIYPRRCPVCDDPAPFGRKICPECENKLVFIAQPYCYKCGRKLIKPSEEYCTNCKNKKYEYEKGRALYEYYSVNKSLYRLKFKGRQEYADYYGDMLARKLGAEILSWKPDAIVPVPMHKKKIKSRGYNQSDLLAKRLAVNLGIPYYNDLIIRQKNTVPLKELSSLERQINLKNAFILRDNTVKLDTVVIVDDIYTTGSTINEMAKCFKANGASKICFIALSIGTGG